MDIPRAAGHLLPLLSAMFAVGCASTLPTPAVDAAPRGVAYVVGGEVRGLRGIGLTLRNARGEEVKIKSDGAFIFNSPVEDGSEYRVSIVREPISPVQGCSIEHGRGRVLGADAMDLAIVCSSSLDEVANASAWTAVAARPARVADGTSRGAGSAIADRY